MIIYTWMDGYFAGIHGEAFWILRKSFEILLFVNALVQLRRFCFEILELLGGKRERREMNGDKIEGNIFC